MKLSDNTESLSEPMSNSKFFTVFVQSKKAVSFNTISESLIVGDSIIFFGNKGSKKVYIGDIISISQSILEIKPKDADELSDMKQEGGLLIGGIIGAAAGAAFAGEDFGGKGVALTLTGTAAGAGLGYWIGNKIVLDSEKPVVSNTDLSAKNKDEKKQILAEMIKKSNQ
ncbi:MAG: hypothetical protein LCH54_03010 [Bacteroidetes bacterium]|nr:hypothetical protein [Bacteroidota bacterium]